MATSTLDAVTSVTCPACLASYEEGTVTCPNDGSALVPSQLVHREQAIAPGTIVGEYRVETMLGEGTFGHVYRCVHPIIGRHAAIKVLKPAFSSDPEMLGRFVEEARAANRIRHRGIIDIFGFGSLPDGRHYYVMEYLEGITLDNYMQTHGPLNLSKALPILRGIARAMDAAHAAGVVHRDLKPANVFMCLEEDQNPRPKVLDFGIAKLLSSDTGTHTRAGTPLGTPHYMSPEQSRGLAVTKATDVYAFGVMVFELLTGSMPFDAETGMDILMQHINVPPPRPSDVNSALPASINAPILQMLAKDPVARPASLTVAVEDLAQATGHTWTLTAPRNSSHSELAAVTVPPARELAKPTLPVSAPSTMTPIAHSRTADTLAPVPAPRSKMPWIVGGSAAAALIGALVVPRLTGNTPATSEHPAAANVSSVAVTPPPAPTPTPVTSAAPAAASVTAEAPPTITPAASAAAAAVPAAKKGAVPAPRPGGQKKPREIDVNPY